MIFNLKHYHIQMTHNKYAQHILAYEMQKWSKLQTARMHKFLYRVCLAKLNSNLSESN